MRIANKLRPQINPIIVREVRTRMRGVRPYAILTAFLILLALAGFGLYYLLLQQTRAGVNILSPQVGQSLFKGLAFFELLFVVFLAPAMTSGAISSEREQLTYDMLIATPLRPGQILWGKLIAALSYLFLLIFAAIPIFSVVFVFGGIEPKALPKVMLLLILTAIAFGAIGLFCSSLLRRTSRASIVSYMSVLLLIGISMLLVSIWGRISSPMGLPPPPEVSYLNPFSALLSITMIAPSSDGSMNFWGYMDPFSSFPLEMLLSPGITYYGPNGVIIMPIYRATYIIYPLLTLILCWASSHLVLPYRRWRPRWSDLGFLVALVAMLLVAWLTRNWWYLAAPQAFG